MTDQPEPFAHAPILEAWAADLEPDIRHGRIADLLRPQRIIPDVRPGAIITVNEETGRLYVAIDRPPVPDGYEYMPGAVLPKPLTYEEARSRDRVYRPGRGGVVAVDGSGAAEEMPYYATFDQAQQVYDAQQRREEA